MSSRWNLDKAYRELAAVVAKHGVELIVFHGGGGALSRAGAPVHEALDGVRRAAADGDNVMPGLMQAVAAYATVGEIMGALRAELGTFREPVRF